MSISEFVYSWIKDLVLLFVIISLVELIMPKGTMRRYINFVVGLLIIFTVINPFINLSNLDFQLERELFRNIDNQIEDSEEDMISNQDAQIESIYKEKIAKEVIAYLEKNTDYKVASLDLQIDKAQENFGAISSLAIWIENERIKGDEESIDIQVKPVLLDSTSIRHDDRDEYIELKELISDEYEIERDLINISTNKLEDEYGRSYKKD